MEISNDFIYSRIKLLLLFVTFPYVLMSQSIVVSGAVFDAVSKKPLEGVVIYIDGTTKGTITNTSGKFSLDSEIGKNFQIVVSYLGYETIYLGASSLNKEKGLIIYLEKKLEELEAVFIQNDDWSREKKLNYFRTHFIGNKEAQRTCAILNEKDIRLYYNANDRSLYASSSVPIQIKNDHLGYEILYNLVDFEVKFSTTGWVNSVYFAGTSFFTEFNSKNKRYQRKRNKVFKGSTAHFMRSLATNTLAENKFELYYKGFKTSVSELLKIQKRNGFAEIYPLVNKTTVLYRKKLKTDIMINTKEFFVIDGLGNFSHPDKIVFNGYMAEQKIARLLPLDYGL
ncbi:carboxypeptidase-like regulatory domain-containing protein [Aquimarina sp. AU474]|uniref:carboxypeptidase-like regulatory domain-containing protein n=1 Tax=Aquimarina sp. AU474 TaxID=2108529 RepID=UPI000D693C4B|nr:carboxypeptidase-like regulatory domain-containing protein [Aquimarina sp. AU474]